jgi:diphosphomevalonate decarboxylase
MAFSVQWRSPSNIAIVKYWGKLKNQIPMNASISFTLSKSYSEMKIIAHPKAEELVSENSFYFEGIRNDNFGKKTLLFLEKMSDSMPWLKDFHFEIYSSNSFPHSAGIASSASSMSALALCIMSLEELYFEKNIPKDQFLIKASELARKASGSASRSLFPKASLWGALSTINNSSDEYAIDMSHDLNPFFEDLQDAIFLVNQNEKSVSSSAGHELMNEHVYREVRIQQANNNVAKLLQVLKHGNWDEFVDICEEEALSLHGLMMSSRPGYLLLEGDSIRLIHFIRRMRSEHGISVTFTIDAGPNIHMLYPKTSHTKIIELIQVEFPEYISENRVIFDNIGLGPKRLI